MKKIRDIVAVTGTYMKNGEEKNRYQRVGSLLQDDEDPKRLSIAWDGLPDSAILHAAATGKNAIWLSCFEPNDEPRQETRRPEPAPEPQGGDDIPF